VFVKTVWARILVWAAVASLYVGGTVPLASSPVVLTNLVSNFNNNERVKVMLAELKAETGIEVVIQSVPGSDEDLRLRVLLGDPVDLIWLPNPNNQAMMTTAHLLVPLDPLARSSEVDLTTLYGSYLAPVQGTNYYLPYELSEQMVFYNRDLFDQAHLPYPKAGWTWDDYIATARKLTDAKRGLWGSLMENWDYYLYFRAHQKGIPDFKYDGTSNFDNPEFSTALAWFGDLGGKYRIQPSWGEMQKLHLGWASMMTGRFAMIVIGSWYLGVMSDRHLYPRNWKFGVASVPVFPDGHRVPVAGGAYGIAWNSKHVEAAFRAIVWLSRHNYQYMGGLPPVADWTPEGFKTAFRDYCEKNLAGEISPDDLYRASVGNGLGTVPEKVLGPAGAAINEMYMKEAENYLLGWRPLDKTMAAIKSHADRLLLESRDR
jgi:multiple sugar transport system substrate-binding protein